MMIKRHASEKDERQSIASEPKKEHKIYLVLNILHFQRAFFSI